MSRPSMTTRVLRYVGNREKPEKELYDPLERMIDRMGIRSQAEFSIGGDLSVFTNIPNVLTSDYEKSLDGMLHLPKRGFDADLTYDSIMALNASTLFNLGTGPVRRAVKPSPEVDFEVNMMEALVGWKSWHWDSKTLKSNGGAFIWKPDVANEAKCTAGCERIPAEHHSCGFYGAEQRETAEEYGSVLGLVHGWGRYVRYSGGWKSQFAYPKCFYLRQEQMNLVDELKKYHVPIYVTQPIQFYDPSEEGYDASWTEEANGSGRTNQEPFAGEEGSPDEDD